MEIDEVFVKDNPGLCRCCLSEGCYKDLASNYAWMGDTEIYADMLLECFDISISQQVEGPNGLTRLICEVCITRLRDACNFKKQVVESENKFIDMIGRGEFRQKVYETSITKQELTFETEETDGTEPEYLHGADYTEPDEDDEVLANLATTSRPQETPKRSRGRPKKTTGKTTPSKTKVKAEKKKVVKEEGKKARDEQNEERLKLRQQKLSFAAVLQYSSALPFRFQSNNFMCFFCYVTFTNFSELKKHTIEEHGDTKYKHVMDNLRIRNAKVDINGLNCKVCSQNVASLIDLTNHLSLHGINIKADISEVVHEFKMESDDEVYCLKCNEKFFFFATLLRHYNKSHRNSDWVCEVCGQAFYSKNNVDLHVRLNHRHSIRCKICSRTFENEKQLDRHLRFTHVLKCNDCSLDFPSRYLLKQHLGTVHGLKSAKFPCTLCSKIFTSKSRMVAHTKRIHLKEKNVVCQICGFEVYDKALLKKHMVKHSDARPFECGFCKKTFARKKTLTTHERIHTNDRRCVCKVCGKAFIQTTSLKIHLRVHHAVDVDKRDVDFILTS